MICRKATVALPDANFLSPWCQSPSSRAQNRGFCALFAFGTPIFGHFEHKIGIFVSETAIFPWFWPLPSTKSRFLCAFALRNPRFRAFRAQNRGFCALLPEGGRPLAGDAYGKKVYIQGTMPEMRARCQRCGGVGRNKKAPAVPEPSMYVCCVRVIVVEYVSTRTCDVYTFLYTFPYARTFVLLHICTFALVRMYVCMCMLVEMEGLEPSSNKTIQKFSTCLAPI